MTSATLAEYPTERDLISAIEHMRALGYRQIDAYAPYFGEELDSALHERRSPLPYVIFVAALFGAGAAYFYQWLTVAYLYPLDTGGRPPHMPLAFAIISFEMGVLSAALTAFVGVIIKARLLRLYDPIFDVEGIERSSIDKHWLRVDSADALYDPKRVRDDLESTSPFTIVDQIEADR